MGRGEGVDVKGCPACYHLYPPNAGFCHIDGTELVALSRLSLPEDRDDSLIGTQVGGRYRVFRAIADGGMGRVYEGLDERARGVVALKVLHPEMARDSIATQRFAREFEVASQLRHPHIVNILDLRQTDDGRQVLVMEYLNGEEVRGVLKREGRLSPVRMIRMLSQVAQALDFAHERQWVHRDLKPDNIFLCQGQGGDDIKVLDFGSVKDRSAGAKQLTVMGTTIGSPFYMSPEQAQGLATVDARSDVWAMAAICYECVTGRVPFTGPHGPSVLLQILGADPEPPSRVAEGELGVPVALDEVMEGGLAKEPSARFAKVGDLANAVGRAYGLEGDHSQWADTNQAELSSRLVIPAVSSGRRASPRQAAPRAVARPNPRAARGLATATAGQWSLSKVAVVALGFGVLLAALVAVFWRVLR